MGKDREWEDERDNIIRAYQHIESDAVYGVSNKLTEEYRLCLWPSRTNEVEIIHILKEFEAEDPD